MDAETKLSRILIEVEAWGEVAQNGKGESDYSRGMDEGIKKVVRDVKKVLDK